MGNDLRVNIGQRHYDAVRDVLAPSDEGVVVADELIDLTRPLNVFVVILLVAGPVDHGRGQDQVIGLEELFVEALVDLLDLLHGALGVR